MEDKATTLRSFPSSILLFIYTAFCGLPGSFQVRPLFDKLNGRTQSVRPFLWEKFFHRSEQKGFPKRVMSERRFSDQGKEALP